MAKAALANDVPAAPDATALRVREEIARRRWSRQAVADKAGISLSTLEKALSGRRPFTLATVVRLEAVFELKAQRQRD